MNGDSFGPERRVSRTLARGRLLVSQEFCVRREGVNRSTDLLIACASWEPRCLAITEVATVEASHSILLEYKDKGRSGFAWKHEEILERWLIKCVGGESVERLTIDTLQPRYGAALLRQAILECARRLSRRINVCIDISAMPRYVFLSVIGYLLNANLAADIVVHYVEAKYELDEITAYKFDIESVDLDRDSDDILRDVQESTFAKYVYTEGEWKTVVVPFLEGEQGLGSGRRVYASLGFDGGQSYQVISQYDPDELLPIMSNPGYTDYYTQLAIQENQKLIVSMGIPSERILQCYAADTCQLLANITDVEMTSPQDHEVLHLCFGSKPHALALGLAAVVSGRASVICRIPGRYIERQTQPSEVSWFYSVRDTSIAPNSNNTQEQTLSRG